MNRPRVLELREYEPACFDANEISAETGEYLYRKYGNKLNVEPPTFKTGYKWSLISKGYVGYIPIDETLGISLQPKVDLDNLFRMLEYAYDIGAFGDRDKSVFGASSLQEFYERLANVLARRVLNRARRGLYRSYLEKRERLPYLRGSLDIRALLRHPWEVRLACEFQEHSADIEENQLLGWTLHRVLRCGACSERVLPTIRKAFRSVKSIVSLRPFSPEVCVGRLYNRLNNDYEPMHALCRFFLENTGPTHEQGHRKMLPFLVDMALLFERFVARWLETHASRRLAVQAKKRVHIGDGHDLIFEIDLAFCEPDSGRPIAVLDTKYKTSESPAADDVQQVVAYAVANKCSDAILIYPKVLSRPFDERIGGIRVRTASFRLDGDLEANGEQFLSSVMEETGSHS